MHSPATILFVDDEPANRHTYGWLFRSAGFEVREAGTGREALALATRECPDLVVLDVGSSRVDLQACKLEYSIVSPK